MASGVKGTVPEFKVNDFFKKNRETEYMRMHMTLQN